MRRERAGGSFMGIKDWFGGDKKKAAFREKIKEAVADGKLDSQDLKNLEKARKELDVTGAGDDRTVLRREVYNEAVAAVKRDGEVTATDAYELAKIQKFLALRDDQVEKTRWDLARLRTLTEIRRGNLPTVPTNNSALRGVQLEPDETAHYSMTVELFDQPSTRQADGLKMEWGQPYEADSSRMHVLPEAGAKLQGEASLILTNRRLVLKTEGGKIAAIRYGPQALIHLYSDGLRLERTVGNTLLRFRSGSEETAEIVGELLGALMK
jgi:predicted nucleic acid-binding protein